MQSWTVICVQENNVSFSIIKLIFYKSYLEVNKIPFAYKGSDQE